MARVPDGRGSERVLGVVLTVGTFDLFHSGHVALLKHCRSLSHGHVVVGVNTDRFVATFKKPPTLPLEERKLVVGACRYVDEVAENDSESLEAMLLEYSPEYLVIGADWAPPRDYMAQIGTTKEWLSAHDIKLVFVPRADSAQSSTKVRQRVVESRG